MKFLNKSKLVLSKDVVARINADGTVIATKMSDDVFIYKIDGVASEVWQQLSLEPKELGPIITNLANDYELSNEQVLDDLQTFLNEALDLNLIQII